MEGSLIHKMFCEICVDMNLEKCVKIKCDQGWYQFKKKKRDKLIFDEIYKVTDRQHKQLDGSGPDSSEWDYTGPDCRG